MIATATPLASDPPRPSSRRVIDAPTRMLHGLLALSFSGAYLSAESERWHALHITLGYTVIGLVLARLLWGLLGPERVRLSSWASKLRGLPQQARAWTQGRGNALASFQGLNTGLVALVLLAALTAGFSGLGLEQAWGGARLEDLLEELHEGLGNGTLALVLAHVGLVVGISLLRRQNHALPMWTGRTPGAGPDLVRQELRPLAALVLLSVLSFWAWQWQQAPLATAERPGHSTGHHEQGADEDDD